MTSQERVGKKAIDFVEETFDSAGTTFDFWVTIVGFATVPDSFCFFKFDKPILGSEFFRFGEVVLVWGKEGLVLGGFDFGLPFFSSLGESIFTF